MTEPKASPGITLNEIAATLQHVNTRIEIHGEESKLAMDLKFAWSASNAALDHFSPTLRQSLYAPEDSKNDAFPNMEIPLTVLRHPQIESYKWTGSEIVGGKLTVHGAVSGNEMIFGDATVGEWRIEPSQGGTVTIKFRAQVYPDHKQRGKIMDLLEQGSVTVSVTPPKPEKPEAKIE